MSSVKMLVMLGLAAFLFVGCNEKVEPAPSGVKKERNIEITKENNSQEVEPSLSGVEP